jgi:hypothetical protein
MTPAAAPETTAAPATTTTLLLRASFVDYQVAATEILAVEGINRAIGFFIVGNFNERETTGLSRETITNEINCGRVDTRLREKFMQRIFRRGKRKISNVKLLHLRTPFARNRDAVAERAGKPERILAGIRRSEAERGQNRARQRSEASSRKLPLFAMRICRAHRALRAARVA